MITHQTQIKINVSEVFKDHIKNRADILGMTLASYIKYLMTKAIEEDIPEFKASVAIEKKASKALANYEKSIEATDIKQFFNNL